MLYENDTQTIIGCAFEVHNTLGAGFLEAVYKNSLSVELRQFFNKVEAEKQLKVFYKEIEVGYYIADIIVNNKIVIEVKVANAINLCHLAQTKNYLRATGCSTGLVINFGGNGVQVKRVFV